MNRLRILTRYIPHKTTSYKSFSDGYKLKRTVSGIPPCPVYEHRTRHPAQEPLLDDNDVIKKTKKDSYKQSVFEIQEQVQKVYPKDKLNNTK